MASDTIDPALFAAPDFDAQTVANTLLFRHGASALPALTHAIDAASKQLRGDLAAHHLQLLVKASSLSAHAADLSSVRAGLAQIQANVQRLQRKLGNKYQLLDQQVEKLQKYQDAAELCRRAARFVALAKRLDAQMKPLASALPSDEKEVALTEAALTVSELESLVTADHLDSSSIRSLRSITFHIHQIFSARQTVEAEMRKMLDHGLRVLDRSLLASSFQTAFNLSVLASSVSALVLELSDAVRNRIRAAFDVTTLAKQAALQGPPPLSLYIPSRD